MLWPQYLVEPQHLEEAINTLMAICGIKNLCGEGGETSYHSIQLQWNYTDNRKWVTAQSVTHFYYWRPKDNGIEYWEMSLNIDKI